MRVSERSPRVHWNPPSFGGIQLCGKNAKSAQDSSTQSTGGNMEAVLRKSLIWMLVGMLALPWSPLGPAESWAQAFKPEEIDALVAPIALYPDDLLSQIFMASTYPLEV